MTSGLRRVIRGAAFGGIALVVGAVQVATAQSAFDANAALRYARTQVEFGPRIPGTDAARKAGDWIVERMRERADTVIVQSWSHRTARGATVPMRNIFARFKPAEATRVLYVVHWDTRPVADNDPDFMSRATPGDGANDGASGVGMLVALADVLKSVPPSVGVDLLFVDGEDYGTFGPD